MKFINAFLFFQFCAFVHGEVAHDDSETIHCTFQAGPVPHNQALGVADLLSLEAALLDAFNDHSNNVFDGSSSNTEPRPLTLKTVEVTEQTLLEVADEEGDRRELQWHSDHFSWAWSYLGVGARATICQYCEGGDTSDRRLRGQHRLRSRRGLSQNPGVASRFREKLKEELEYFADAECVMVECDGLKFDATPECL